MCSLEYPFVGLNQECDWELMEFLIAVQSELYILAKGIGDSTHPVVQKVPDRTAEMLERLADLMPPVRAELPTHNMNQSTERVGTNAENLCHSKNNSKKMESLPACCELQSVRKPLETLVGDWTI